MPGIKDLFFMEFIKDTEDKLFQNNSENELNNKNNS